MRTSHARRRPILTIASIAVLVLASGALLTGSTGLAQIQNNFVSGPTPQERIDIHAGDIIEIQGVSDMTDPQYTWVLTKDQTFIQADRAQVFRTRLVDVGNYMIDAIAEAGDNSQTQMRRLIIISVLPRTVPLQSDQSGSSVLRTFPPLLGGVVTLPGSNQIILLSPAPGSTRLIVDTDVTRDTNGDGNPSDDIDNSDTFALTDGTSLFLWLVDRPSRSMQATVLGADGAPTAIPFTIVSNAANQIIGGSDTIQTTESAGWVQFSLPYSIAFTPAVYQWDFGDGTQSLFFQPVHRYTRNDSYHVTVNIISLLDGHQMLNGASYVTVTTAPETSSSSASASSTASSTAGGSLFSSIPFALIVRIVLIGLVILIIGGLLVWLFVRLRRLSLARTLEKMEDRVMDKPATDLSAPPLPMKIRREDKKPDTSSDIVDATIVPEEKMEETPPAASIDLTQAPSWLAKGLEKADESPASNASDESPASSADFAEASEELPATVTEAPTDAQDETESTEDEFATRDTESIEQESSTDTAMSMPPVDEPAPIPQPKEKVEEMAPPPPAPKPAPQAPAQPKPQAPSAATQAKEPDDRERERRRLKRQRYRQNLQKRRLEAIKAQREQQPKVAAPTPSPAPAPAPQTQPTTPPPPPDTLELNAPVPQKMIDAPAPQSQIVEPKPADEKSDDSVVFTVSADTLQKPSTEKKEENTESDNQT